LSKRVAPPKTIARTINKVKAVGKDSSDLFLLMLMLSKAIFLNMRAYLPSW
jgi:hypothetical protein